MADEEQLTITVRLDDQASAGLVQLRQSMASFSAGFNADQMRQFNQQANEAARNARALESSMGALATRAGFVGGVVAGVTVELGRMGLELARRAVDLHAFSRETMLLGQAARGMGTNIGQLSQNIRTLREAGLSAEQATKGLHQFNMVIGEMQRLGSRGRMELVTQFGESAEQMVAFADRLDRAKPHERLNMVGRLIRSERERITKLMGAEAGAYEAQRLSAFFGVPLDQVRREFQQMAEWQLQLYATREQAALKFFDSSEEAYANVERILKSFGGIATVMLGPAMARLEHILELLATGGEKVEEFVQQHPELQKYIQEALEKFGYSIFFGPYGDLIRIIVQQLQKIGPPPRPGGTPQRFMGGFGETQAYRFIGGDIDATEENTEQTEQLTEELARLNEYFALVTPEALGVLTTQMGGLQPGLGGGGGVGGGGLGGGYAPGGGGGGRGGPGGGGAPGGAPPAAAAATAPTAPPSPAAQSAAGPGGPAGVAGLPGTPSGPAARGPTPGLTPWGGAAGIPGLPGTQAGPAGIRPAPGNINAAGVQGLAGGPSGPAMRREGGGGGGVVPTGDGVISGGGATYGLQDRGNKRIPASIRYNNPGAQWPSQESKRFGQTDVGVIGGGNKIAGFPTPVHGLASNIALLKRRYVGKTIGAAIHEWSGGGRSSVPGYSSGAILTKEVAEDPNFWKTMAGAESGRKGGLSDKQIQQAIDMEKAGSAAAYEQANPDFVAENKGRQAPATAPSALPPGYTQPADLSITDITGQSARVQRGMGGELTNPQAIITHYTAGDTLKSAVGALNERGLGYHYLVDKDGKIHQFTPSGRTGAHMTTGRGPMGEGLSNANTIGVSAVATNEDDMTPAQETAMQQLTASLGRKHNIPPSRVFGHGEVNPGRRAASEGARTYRWARGLKEWPKPPAGAPPGAELDRAAKKEVTATGESRIKVEIQKSPSGNEKAGELLERKPIEKDGKQMDSDTTDRESTKKVEAVELDL